MNRQTVYAAGPDSPAFAEGGWPLRLLCALLGGHWWCAPYQKPPFGRWVRACRVCGREERS